MSIAISNFVRRQTKDSKFSYYAGDDKSLLDMVHANFDKAQLGYRKGVLLVQVPHGNFFSGIVQLKEGDRLEGSYEARQAGEEPRKSTYVVGGQKIPALRADIVLYSHDVLAENNEQSSDADWEIISINASPTEDIVPIPLGALLANHFELSGGTATHMTDSEFIAQLRETVLWWRDKGMAGEPKFK